MANFVSNFVTMATGISQITITRYVFHPENDFSGFLDPKNLNKHTKFITP